MPSKKRGSKSGASAAASAAGGPVKLLEQSSAGWTGHSAAFLGAWNSYVGTGFSEAEHSMAGIARELSVPVLNGGRAGAAAVASSEPPPTSFADAASAFFDDANGDGRLSGAAAKDVWEARKAAITRVVHLGELAFRAHGLISKLPASGGADWPAVGKTLALASPAASSSGEDVGAAWLRAVAAEPAAVDVTAQYARFYAAVSEHAHKDGDSAAAAAAAAKAKAAEEAAKAEPPPKRSKKAPDAHAGAGAGDTSSARAGRRGQPRRLVRLGLGRLRRRLRRGRRARRVAVEQLAAPPGGRRHQAQHDAHARLRGLV
jgi:hypothetical protein